MSLEIFASYNPRPATLTVIDQANTIITEYMSRGSP